MWSFPKSCRLLHKVDYKAVFDRSGKVSQKYLLVLFKTNQRVVPRLGLVVGKKVAPHAVTRNSIKRVIRESFRLKQDRLKGLDVVVIARHQCNTLSKQELRKGIDRLWENVIVQYQAALSS